MSRTHGPGLIAVIGIWNGADFLPAKCACHRNTYHSGITIIFVQQIGVEQHNKNERFPNRHGRNPEFATPPIAPNFLNIFYLFQKPKRFFQIAQTVAIFVNNCHTPMQRFVIICNRAYTDFAGNGKRDGEQHRFYGAQAVKRNSAKARLGVVHF